MKAVIIGFSHMHVNEIAQYINDCEGFDLVGIAEAPSDIETIPALRYTPVWNFENVRDNFCSNVYEDYRVMLDELKPDYAFILSENCQKPEIVEECAKRGVNVSIEKPMAVSLAEAEKIEASVKRYGIEAVVNWPVVWRPYLHRMKAAIDAGIVGEPIRLRYLNGHTGPLGKGARHRGVSSAAEEMQDSDRAKTWWHTASHGGGNLLDIGCYGCLFTEWFLGEGAESVVAYGAELNTPFGNTEDNFAAIIGFEGKKMSVIEGTWTTPAAAIPSGPMLTGTNGSIICTGTAGNNPNLVAYDLTGRELEIPEIDLGKAYANMPEHLMHRERTGAPLQKMVTLEENMKVIRLLDTVVRAASSHTTEKV